MCVCVLVGEKEKLMHCFNDLPILCVLNFSRYHAERRDQGITGSDIWGKESSCEEVPAYHVLVSQIQARKPLPRPTCAPQ